MGTLTDEPRKVYRGVRFTLKEDLEIRKMMKQEDYLSVSKYIRDKTLSKTGRKERTHAAAAAPGPPGTLHALVTLLLHSKLRLQDPVHRHLLGGSPSTLPIPVFVLPPLTLLLYS